MRSPISIGRCSRSSLLQSCTPRSASCIPPALQSSACRDRNAPVTLRGSSAISVGRAHRHDFAAAHARAGAEVDDVVGRPHRVFIVLDDDDRVAQVAQAGERGEQPLVVARVQADRRFVEDVEHADQAAADLPGQADALRLAAGKRGGGAFEREVFEADIRARSRAGRGFPSAPRRRSASRCLPARARRRTRPRRTRPARILRAASAVRPIGELRAGRGERHRARLRIEPLARAIGAADHAHVLFELPNLHRGSCWCDIFPAARG